MENKMEATIVYWGYIGILENKMEATIVYWGYIGSTQIYDFLRQMGVLWGDVFLDSRGRVGLSYMIDHDCLAALHVQVLVQVLALNS